MGKSTISMAIFNSYVKLPEGIWYYMGLFGRSFFFPNSNGVSSYFPYSQCSFLPHRRSELGMDRNRNWGASPCRVDTAAMLDSPKGAPCMGAVHASKFVFFLLGDWVPEFQMGIMIYITSFTTGCYITNQVEIIYNTFTYRDHINDGTQEEPSSKNVSSTWWITNIYQLGQPQPQKVIAFATKIGCRPQLNNAEVYQSGVPTSYDWARDLPVI